jgi:very-short-patch-repair endonuclease
MASPLGGEGLTPSPLGEGWGEVALCFELESQHAYQEYCYRSNSHQSKTGTRKRTASRDDSSGKLLWQEVRANKLGVRFRRQQVIQGFIVDFYCHQAGLVVEVDGGIHDLQKEEDERREKVLSEMGLRIVRFQNDEVERGLSAVVRKIRQAVN